MSKENSKKYAVIMGARPNFVKAAAFFHEAKKHPEYHFTIIHTGQHFDDNMSKIFFDDMQIPQPDIHLHIEAKFHTERIGKTFTALRKVFQENNFDSAIVFGDVNSTLAGALAAIKGNCRLIHIEAGLRSHDRRMPEEINRVIVDHLSDLLFTTENSANENLALEGIEDEKVKYVGNIMINSLELFRDKINTSDILNQLNLEPKDYIVATIHRQENTDDLRILKKILTLLNKLNKNIKILFPLHSGTRNKIVSLKLDHLLDNLTVIEPLGYFDFMKLMMESRGVVTDSGGIQEETTHLGIPCATLRDNTERPVTVAEGSNKLFTLEGELDDVEIIEHLSCNDFIPNSIPLWDGLVAHRIFRHLDV